MREERSGTFSLDARLEDVASSAILSEFAVVQIHRHILCLVVQSHCRQTDRQTRERREQE